MAALRLAHNVAGLPPQRDNLGHSQVRVSSQHPAQLTAFSRRENLARPLGCQNRRPARWRPTLTVLQTQPKGGSASCGGNFKTQHHNTLTLLGIFILDTTAPHIRKYVTRLYCWSARSFQRAPPLLRRWQLGFVMASAATCQGGVARTWRGRTRARYALRPLSLVSLSVPAPVAPPIVLWQLPRHQPAW